MDKKAASLLILLIFAFLIASVHLELAHASSDITGIIRENTIWTKANSPYTLIGPVAVDAGVTLTIEPGVVVNLNEKYIQVNGTLRAQGTDNDKIHFNSGSVIFTSVSQGWNEFWGSGSIIQNAVSTGSFSAGGSVKITQSSLNELEAFGSSLITYNTIRSIGVGESATVTNNEITGKFSASGGTIAKNIINTRIMVSGSPIISDNKIFDGVHADARVGPVTITNNEISSKNNFMVVFVSGIHAEIVGNKIIGNGKNPAGVRISSIFSSATITQNQIYGCQIGIDVSSSNVTINKNAILNNDVGVNIFLGELILPGSSGIWATRQSVNIQENTIVKNAIGIQFAFDNATGSIIKNNNIQENSQYNFQIKTSKNISIPDNWWGTTDTEQISQKIYDQSKDFNLGIVNFNPVLMAPNSQAPPIPTDIPTPTPTPTPTTTPIPTHPPSEPTPTPSQSPTPMSGTNQGINSVEVAILAVLIVIATLLTILIALVVRKKR